jgi:hypothetical protein
LDGARLSRALLATGGDAASHEIDALLEGLAGPDLLADGANAIFEFHDVKVRKILAVWERKNEEMSIKSMLHDFSCAKGSNGPLSP